MKKRYYIFVILFLFTGLAKAQLIPVTPPEERGRIDAERSGLHDANNIRTVMYNYGMVGDYPPDPINVDLSIFHSVEIPKGRGENYSDGITPFVLAKVIQNNGNPAYIMETGFRERQGTSPISNKTMRFEPRPGYFQIDPEINKGRSVALSNDPRTWPNVWYDKRLDADDPGWSGWWNGYFGKEPRADQESYLVYDDNFYDAWDFYPDMRDNTRRGLGLRIEQRGFQWSNPQAGNVIFFHYDITNEATTAYNDNILFGLYMDSGVGGSGVGVDGIAESDDDNAFFERSAALNLVYTWDKNGNGMRGKTGYLGYSYLETPGNSVDLADNDEDGILNEKRDGGPGQKIMGQDAIRNYVATNYNMIKYEQFYGPLEKRPAYLLGEWWTGDEDLDWIAEFHDTGADGIFGTNDTGEKDGIPTNGEASFDKTDIDESDQIGLTGFKMNRIKAGQGAPSTAVDNIVFFDDGKEWPKRLYTNFTNPDSSFDNPLALNYNIGFLFASGPFTLSAGKTERFSLALSYGADLRELRNTTKIVQQIYKANYQFAVPPPLPTLTVFAGDKFVTLSWDNASEKAFDPITNNNDFEGYRVYRSTDPAFLDPKIIVTGTGSSPIGNGKPIAQFDLVNDFAGYSTTVVEGVAYYLGDNTGLRHTFKDTSVVNGQKYYYAVTAYDRGVDSAEIYPSENAINVSRTLRGGPIFAKNVYEAIPNRQVLGFEGGFVDNIQHSEGDGVGEVNLLVLNPLQLKEDHVLQINFINHPDSVRAEYYYMTDATDGDTLFLYGSDLSGEGSGPVAQGILPVINTPIQVQIDSAKSGLTISGNSNVKVTYRYSPGLPVSLRRVNFPENIEIVFSDTFLDTSVAGIGVPQKPAKFRVVAKTKAGDVKMKFRFRDQNNLNTISKYGDYIEILTYQENTPALLKPTWKIDFDSTGLGSQTVIPLTTGDKFNLNLLLPYSDKDVFTFNTKEAKVNLEKAKNEFNEKPYVVPNPYVGAASFEPQRYAVSGRGERKIEFRNLPFGSTVRIYTVTGDLVNTLHQDGSYQNGYIAWDLRSKDNLEIAPGLYIYHVEGPEVGTFIGKFSVIK
ncbi:MAG: hypothetical protein AB9882_04495 [Ignavibacteriaceae bacterium]